jgi:hypothetical protein
MSSAPLPHQQYISGTSATGGAQAFAGINLGKVYYGHTGAREREHIKRLDPVFESVELILRLASTQKVPPKPFSTVPFRRDPDFVDRGDTLAQIDQRCSQPASRAALVGLGGVG